MTGASRSGPYRLSGEKGQASSASPRYLWLVLALSVLLGCGDSIEEKIVLRFMAEEPEEHLEPEALLDTVFSWHFTRDSDLEGWSVTGATDGSFDRGLRLAERGPVTLGREVDLTASAVDSFAVRATDAGKVSLLWAAPGQPLSDRRSLTVVRTSRSRAAQVFRFPVGSHPEWQGRIGRLSLRLHKIGQRMKLEELTALSADSSTGRLDPVLSRSWKVNLAGEIRNALLGGQGTVHERRFRIPASAELWFAYAVQPGVTSPVRFTVSVQAVGRAPRQLLEALVVPVISAKDARPLLSWRRAVVDLTPYAGEEVDVRLETTAAAEWDPLAGLALWADPEIVVVGRSMPNLVLISIDTLRADRMSLYGNPRPTTPGIDAWAAQSGVVFDQTVAPASWTLPAHISMLSGLDAHRHGVQRREGKARIPRLLAERLREAGYVTAAVTGGGYLDPRFGFSRGFHSFRSWDQVDRRDELETHVGHALEWLETAAGTRPFFLFFHTYEVHEYLDLLREPYFSSFSSHDPNVKVRPWPVRGPEKSFFLVGEKGRRTPLPPHLSSLPTDRYDSNLAYADAQVSRLLERLREPDFGRSTIVVLTSDHGELLGEHGVSGHTYAFEENMIIPLVIAAPGLGATAGRVEEQVRSVDVVPTVLELAGLPAAEGIDGVSLLPAMKDSRSDRAPEAWNVSVRDGISLRAAGRLKYVFQTSMAQPNYGSELLFDLNQDPREERNVIESAQQAAGVRRRLRQEVDLEISGLRILLQNGGAEVLRVALEVDLRGALSADPLCESLSWTHERPVTLNLPPGCRFSFLLPRFSKSTLGISLGRYGDVDAFSTSLDTDELSGIGSLSLEEKVWRVVLSGAAPETGVSVWWQGRRTRGGETLPLDSDLQRQLEALGYVGGGPG